MANLGSKQGIYHVRFRYNGKEFKRSLKISDAKEAKCALNIVEQTLHRLHTGQISIPDDVDPGDFVVSGGTAKPKRQMKVPSLKDLTTEFLEHRQGKSADSYIATQRIHFGHLTRFLGSKAEFACDKIGTSDLQRFLNHRLTIRDANTVSKERMTILQLFKYGQQQQYLSKSPADALEAIFDLPDLPPFKTVTEVEELIAREGLTDKQNRELWECLYLNAEEIAGLLELVRSRAHYPLSYLLHVIPAYTGMRRGEALRLRWLDVNLISQTVTVYSRKQSRKQHWTKRVIDMHPELAAELQSWQKVRSKGQYVLSFSETLQPLNPDEANRLFWQPMRHTTWCLDSSRNLFKIGFHTYRHSFASNLAARSVDQRIIDAWMGHQSEQMRKRYQHLFPNLRRAAIESFSLRNSSRVNGHATGTLEV